METIRQYLQDYLILLLVMRVAVYLVPQEKNQMFLRKVVGLWMTLILLAPVLSLWKQPDLSQVYQQMQELETRVRDLEYEEGEETIFELFTVEEMQGENP